LGSQPRLKHENGGKPTKYLGIKHTSTSVGEGKKVNPKHFQVRRMLKFIMQCENNITKGDPICQVLSLDFE
jgi:hypothetical protein